MVWRPSQAYISALFHRSRGTQKLRNHFQSGHRRGSKLYLTGISEAGTGKEIFYLEIPLE